MLSLCVRRIWFRFDDNDNRATYYTSNTVKRLGVSRPTHFFKCLPLYSFIIPPLSFTEYQGEIMLSNG